MFVYPYWYPVFPIVISTWTLYILDIKLERCSTWIASFMEQNKLKFLHLSLTVEPMFLLGYLRIFRECPFLKCNIGVGRILEKSKNER